jgi:hypothetical protein
MNLTDLFEGFDVRASGMPGNSRRKISASRRISKGGVLETVTEVSYTSPVMKNVYELRSNMKINELSPNIIRPIQPTKPGATPATANKPGTPPAPGAPPVGGAKPAPGAVAAATGGTDTPLPVVKTGITSVALNPNLARKMGLPPNKTIDNAKILKVTNPGKQQTTTVELPKMPGMAKGVQLTLPAAEYGTPAPTKLSMAKK